jgi:hypothetical protein
MPGLVPGSHVFLRDQDVDGRGKPGHDERMYYTIISRTCVAFSVQAASRNARSVPVDT